MSWSISVSSMLVGSSVSVSTSVDDVDEDDTDVLWAKTIEKKREENEIKLSQNIWNYYKLIHNQYNEIII